MFRSKGFRKAVYLASAPSVLVLTAFGVDGNKAAALASAALAFGNIVMAALNVPGDDDGDGIPDE